MRLRLLCWSIIETSVGRWLNSASLQPRIKCSGDKVEVIIWKIEIIQLIIVDYKHSLFFACRFRESVWTSVWTASIWFFFIQYETIYFTESFNFCCCYHYWDFQTCDIDAVNFTKSRHRILRVFKLTESTLPVKLWKIMWIMFFSYCYFITCFWIYSKLLTT